MNGPRVRIATNFAIFRTSDPARLFLDLEQMSRHDLQFSHTNVEKILMKRAAAKSLHGVSGDA